MYYQSPVIGASYPGYKLCLFGATLTIKPRKTRNATALTVNINTPSDKIDETDHARDSELILTDECTMQVVENGNETIWASSKIYKIKRREDERREEER